MRAGADGGPRARHLLTVAARVSQVGERVWVRDDKCARKVSEPTPRAVRIRLIAMLAAKFLRYSIARTSQIRSIEIPESPDLHSGLPARDERLH